jgi:hemoglobin
MKRAFSNLMVVLSLAAVFGLALNASPALAQEATGQEATDQEPSLYDRLGGVYSIATVVDALIERLLVNDVLNANPKIKEARDRVPKAGLKFRLTALVCQATGGPEVYNGRSMKEAHAHLNISEEEWDVMVADFLTTLNQFEVPEKEQKELLAIIAPTKADIVTAKSDVTAGD